MPEAINRAILNAIAMAGRRRASDGGMWFAILRPACAKGYGRLRQGLRPAYAKGFGEARHRARARAGGTPTAFAER